MGAMENKGLNIFNTKYVLADPATATDADYADIEARGRPRVLPQLDRQPRHLPRLVPAVAEGRPDGLPRPGILAATWRHARRARSSASRTCACCARAQFPEDAGPMAHPVRPDSYVEINNFYTVDRLREGRRGRAHDADAARPRRLRAAAWTLYFERHDGQAVTCDDFAQAIADANPALRPRRSSSAGTPGRHAARDRARPLRRARRARYTLDARADAARRRRASRRKQPFVIPVARRPGRRATAATCRCSSTARPRRGGTTRVLELTRAAQRFTFVDVDAAAGAVAAARLLGAGACSSTTTATPSCSRCCAHDSDPFNRWEAGQRLVRQRDPARSRARTAKAAPLALPPMLGARRRGACSPTASDPALLALALALPDAAYVAALEHRIDVDGVTAARTFDRCARSRDRPSRGDFERAYRRASPGGTLRADAGAGRRRAGCRNVVPALSRRARRRRRARARAVAQFDDADNMTDAIARARGARATARSPARDDLVRALRGAVARRAAGARQVVRAAGAQRARRHARARARAARPSALQRAQPEPRALAGRRVRARATSRASTRGRRGYAFIAEQVLALDATQPAARRRAIAGAFNLWKRFPEPRRAQMQRGAASGIARAPELSPDVSEIVTRSLSD